MAPPRAEVSRGPGGSVALATDGFRFREKGDCLTHSVYYFLIIVLDSIVCLHLV